MSDVTLGLVPLPRLVERKAGFRSLPATTEVLRALVEALPPEGYVLDVSKAKVRIAGGSDAGIFYGEQTLLQLLPPDRLRTTELAQALAAGAVDVPCVHIEDAPAYPWRGFMLDVARHFFPVEFVLRMIDQLAAHKLNVLHLHLTDDQGWRIPIPGYPRLTDVGAWRPETIVGFDHEGETYERDGEPHGGTYMRAELEQIVAYAAERHIDVLPEVDFPGHVRAAIAAYPELGNGDPGEVRTRWGHQPPHPQPSVLRQ